MQVQTERGLVCVAAEYKSFTDAINDGYSYTFTVHNCKGHPEYNGCDFYSKILDDEGHRRRFIVVVG